MVTIILVDIYFINAEGFLNLYGCDTFKYNELQCCHNSM